MTGSAIRPCQQALSLVLLGKHQSELSGFLFDKSVNKKSLEFVSKKGPGMRCPYLWLFFIIMLPSWVMLQNVFICRRTSGTVGKAPGISENWKT